MVSSERSRRPLLRQPQDLSGFAIKLGRDIKDGRSSRCQRCAVRDNGASRAQAHDENGPIPRLLLWADPF